MATSKKKLPLANVNFDDDAPAPVAEEAGNATDASEVTFGSKEVFGEWECKISNKSYDRLKRMRDVSITQEQADILNEGVLNGGNTYGKMYLK